jgi:hypothetical protein
LVLQLVSLTMTQELVANIRSRHPCGRDQCSAADERATDATVEPGKLRSVTVRYRTDGAAVADYK